MLKRTLTGIVMTLVIVPLVYFGSWFYVGLIAILSYLAGYEVINMVAKRYHNLNKLKYIVPFFNVILILSYPIFDYSLAAPLLISLAVVLFFLAMNVVNANFNVQYVMILLLNYFYTGLLFLAMLWLRHPEAPGFINEGLYLIGYLFVVVVLSDVGAYTLGSLFGKHKLCPTISPNKSVEGFVGGLVLSVASGIAYYFLVKEFAGIGILGSFNYVWMEILVAILTTLIVSIASTIGDLVASKLKREFEVKDYGFIFPGHGGVMDRFDSTIFASGILVLILFLVAI